jgi:fucose permease
VAAVLVVFTLYTAAEASTGAWAFTVLTQSRHVDRGVAGVAVAAYWGALTAGRFGVAAIGHRVGRGRAICGGAALALVGVVVFAVGGRLGALGLPLAGLGFAPMFPVMVSLIPDRVGVARSATVIGWAIGLAAVGGPVGTALAGAVADGAGVAAIGLVLAGLSALVLVAGVIAFQGDP